MVKFKLKKEEEARKHWQEVAKKKEDEIAEVKKVSDEVQKQLENEKA
jgi:hypothetical protein